MKNLFKIAAVAVMGMACSGCVAVIAMTNRPSHPPAYCYDCHAYPGWVRVYTSCDHYIFKVSGNGYYYQPRHVKHSRFVYRGFNAKTVKARRQKHLEFLESLKHEEKKHDKRENNLKKNKRIRS